MEQTNEVPTHDHNLNKVQKAETGSNYKQAYGALRMGWETFIPLFRQYLQISAEWRLSSHERPRQTFIDVPSAPGAGVVVGGGGGGAAPTI